MLLFQVFTAILIIVFAGTTNMVFVKKAPFPKVPMDFGKNWLDGKRIFGDNKTWKGFMGMILFTSIWFAIFGVLAKLVPNFDRWNMFPLNSYHLGEELMYGAIWGFGYVAAELPNSFIKRRLDIHPGKPGHGQIKYLFVFIDQADSAFGCCLAMLLFYRPSIWALIILFGLGVGIHFGMNVLLYKLKLKSSYL